MAQVQDFQLPTQSRLFSVSHVSFFLCFSAFHLKIDFTRFKKHITFSHSPPADGVGSIQAQFIPLQVTGFSTEQESFSFSTRFPPLLEGTS